MRTLMVRQEASDWPEDPTMRDPNDALVPRAAEVGPALTALLTADYRVAFVGCRSVAECNARLVAQTEALAAVPFVAVQLQATAMQALAQGYAAALAQVDARRVA